MAITANGYDLDELLSALQKFIRRGLEYEALHIALELEAFEPNGKITLWNRLKVIASEDIGFAYPLMPILIDVLHKHYEREKSRVDKIPDPYIFVSNAIVCLCRSPKNRSTDDLLNVVLLEREKGISVQIPDFALDMHTAKGREKFHRGWEHFFNEGSKLENESGSNPWKDKHRKLRNL